MFRELTVDNVVLYLIQRGGALSPDLETKAANLIVAAHGRQVSYSYGLTEAQIDEVDRIIDRVAQESTMTYTIAEDRLRARLSDWDNDLRALFVATFLDGDMPHRMMGPWCDEAHRIMTERKSERVRIIFGLTPEQAREARASL